MITIFNRETNEIFIEERFGLTDNEKAKGHYMPGKGITGKVVDSGTPIVVPDISKEPLFPDRTGSSAVRDESPGGLVFICVPILWDNDVTGTISTLKKENKIFSLDEDQKLLSVIAAFISQAVKIYQTAHEKNTRLKAENKRLHEQLHARLVPPNIIGRSNAMRQVYQIVAKISQTLTLLILTVLRATGPSIMWRK